MKKFLVYATPKTIGIAAVVILGGGYFLFFSGTDSTQETIVVTRGDFLQQVSVSGKVTASQNVELGFTQSGRVSHVYAKVGDFVSAGSVLSEIENGDLYAAVLQRQAALDAQQAKLDALKQGTRPEEIAIAESSVESARVSLSQANSALLDALRDAYTTSDDAVRNELYQFISNPRSINPQLAFSSSDSQLAVQLLNKVPQGESKLTEWSSQLSLATADNLSAVITLSQGNLSFVSGMLSDAGSLLTKAIPNPSTTQTTINGYSTDIASARASVDAVSSAVTSAITAQKSAVSSLNSAEKNLALKQAGAIQADIDGQAAQVKAAEADLVSARAQLAKTRIVAPFSGVVTKMDAKIGLIVSPNTSEVSLISNGTFQVESYIPEINVALVKVGDAAVVTLDAYGSEVPFTAKIVSIDPAETIRDGVPMYRAVLEFSQKDDRVKSGMTANVVITTEKREGIISIPQGLIQIRDGKRFVTVKSGDTQKDVEVTTGSISSSGNIEIVSGLSEGDVVVVTQ